ncbi:MAG: hypothetical protein ACR2PS_09755 [Pseudomonadales bacterium]
MHVVSIGDYYADVSDNGEHSAPANLRDRLAPLCRERHRRIDRFIELSLLGSGLCAANLPTGIDLESQAALYIASGLASMSNIVKVQQQIFMHGNPPKPANFINTLSNSAGYYVARNLGLRGKNIFVSRENSSFEAALQLIALDFVTGASRCALLGVVDECPPPLDQQRKRMRLGEDALLAEGSHWFFLRPASELVPSFESLASISMPQTLKSASEVFKWLELQTLKNTAIHLNQCALLTTDCADLVAGVPRFQAPLGHYGARSAGISSRFITTGDHSSLISINKDKVGRFHVMRIDRMPKA